MAENPGAPRTGAVTVNGLTATVTQQGGCSYSLSASAQQIPASGGTGSASVTAPGGCGWTAASQQPWITTVTYSVAPNTTGQTRLRTVAVQDQVFTVTQNQCRVPVTGPLEPPAGILPVR